MLLKFSDIDFKLVVVLWDFFVFVDMGIVIVFFDAIGNKRKGIIVED